MNWTAIWVWLKNPTHPAPVDLVKYAGRRAKFRTPKDAIKFPKGAKDKRSRRDTLETELDELCRQAYKRRDCPNGYGNCISCERLLDGKSLQWGHFVAQGQSLWLRWDMRNSAAQCVRCNIFSQGEQARFAMALDKKHGVGFAAGLILEANRYKSWHPSIQDLEDKKMELKVLINNGGQQ